MTPGDHARDPDLVLETARLRLRLPGPEAAGEVVQFLRGNAGHLAPWEPPRPTGFLTEPWWAGRLQRGRDEFVADKSLRLFLFARADDTIVGWANFTGIERGSLQGCRLGYAIGASHEGRGLMSEALTRAVGYVFDVLNIHRIEANHLPDNQRSADLLRRLGFERQGFARAYLFINGAWRDHVLTAKLNPRELAVET